MANYSIKEDSISMNNFLSLQKDTVSMVSLNDREGKGWRGQLVLDGQEGVVRLTDVQQEEGVVCGHQHSEWVSDIM